jgi:ACS family allantoate permease-like MFS transporter
MAPSKPIKPQLAYNQSLVLSKTLAWLANSLPVSFLLSDVEDMIESTTKPHILGLTTIFYLTYLVCEAPANYIMQRVNLGHFLSGCMFFWGVIVLCTAFATNWTTLMVLRGLQGALECTISPTFLLITGAWYTSREHTMRAIIWGTANAGMNIISGLANYGIGLNAQANPGGLAAWKGISFFLGALTILDSVLVFFIIGTPREVRWLSADEKRAAMARVLSNQTGSGHSKHSQWNWEQAFATFKDPQTYFFFFVTIVNSLPNGANTTFGKLVWVSFGFTNLETLIKGSVPQYCFSIVWFLIVGIVTLKKPNLRCKCLNILPSTDRKLRILVFFMMVSLIPAFVGMLTLSLLPSTGYLWLRWAMYMMTVFGSLPGLRESIPNLVVFGS